MGNPWTPGPWHYSPTHYGKAFDIGAADGDNVALIYGPEENGSDWFRANARLIAASPTMAALLESAATHFEGAPDPEDVAFLATEIRALLSIIRGETP